MRLITADWVLPVTSPPIRDGAVLVEGELVVDVGPRSLLEAEYPEAAHELFAGHVITPGLVNAHTHLTLSALSGVVPPLPFTEWLPRLVASMKPWEIADHEASGVIGAEESLLAGVTVVGDIAYGAAEVASASGAGLGGVYYWELLGLEADAVDSALAELRYPATRDQYGARVVCGLSPHSPYTSGPGLLAAVDRKARELDVPMAIHVAESVAETELMMSGTGSLAAVASRTAIGFSAPQVSSVEYLVGIGALDDATAVHVCQASESDIALLARVARGVVTCPRSNRYLSNIPPSVAKLLAAGLAVGVGTDSSASNDDLDLMAEVRAVRDAEPQIPMASLLELATILGATAIGVEDRYGSLERGKQADLAVFALDVAGDPVAAVVAGAGAATLRAVMSGGAWRVRGGALLHHDTDSALRSHDATAAARLALGEFDCAAGG